jgi:hypothetical protein
VTVNREGRAMNAAQTPPFTESGNPIIEAAFLAQRGILKPIEPTSRHASSFELPATYKDNTTASEPHVM